MMAWLSSRIILMSIRHQIPTLSDNIGLEKNFIACNEKCAGRISMDIRGNDDLLRRMMAWISHAPSENGEYEFIVLIERDEVPI